MTRACSERDLGWLEGIIDGEGCLGLYSSPVSGKNGPRRRWLPLLTITNTNRAIIDRAKGIVGAGSVYRRKGVSERDKPFFHYAIGANGLRSILPVLRLTAKEQQRLLLLEALALSNGKTHNRYNGCPYDPRLREIEAKTHALNRRGREDP